MKNLEFVAVGDIVTDAFIKLKDARVNCDINDEHCTITLPFAEKIPYEEVYVVPAVGNAPNAAVAASRLGLSSALVTNLGGDTQGKECIDTLKKENVSTDYVSVHEGEKTNYHYVLWYEKDRTILVKHEKYSYNLPDLGGPGWVYLSSIGSHTDDYHRALLEYLEKHRETKLAFQPGTFQMPDRKNGEERLPEEIAKKIYERAEISFCNVEEAERILGIDTLGTKELLKRMRDLGPKTVVITDGPKGAYAYDGERFLFQAPYPDEDGAYERTGAGDAFSSTTVSALALGRDLSEALAWGAVNSMSVVGEVGAQKGLLTREKLFEYMDKAPENFAASPMKE